MSPLRAHNIKSKRFIKLKRRLSSWINEFDTISENKRMVAVKNNIITPRPSRLKLKLKMYSGWPNFAKNNGEIQRQLMTIWQRNKNILQKKIVFRKDFRKGMLKARMLKNGITTSSDISFYVFLNSKP